MDHPVFAERGRPGLRPDPGRGHDDLSGVGPDGSDAPPGDGFGRGRRVSRTHHKIPERTGVRDPLASDLSELFRLSLIEMDADGNPAAHRLIQAFVRHRNVADNASPFDDCVNVIGAEFRLAVDNPGVKVIRALEALVPHAEFLLADGRLIDQGVANQSIADQSMTIASGLGAHHKTLGRLSAAKQVWAAALETAEKTYKPGHEEIAMGQSNLALVLQDLGEVEEARDLLRKRSEERR